jgi:hypothetical protein
MQGATQPLPRIAGAATGFIQTMTGAVVRALVTTLHLQHSALSMTALMAVCALLALASYLLLARPAERAGRVAGEAAFAKPSYIAAVTILHRREVAS